MSTIAGVDGDGPFTLQLAEQAPPQRGNGRLVVISHGSGGGPWVHADLARTLVEAGFVVAVPQHHADNSKDGSDPGPASWAIRPQEVSRAIDAVGRDTPPLWRHHATRPHRPSGHRCSGRRARAADFDIASLVSPRVPLGLVTAQGDRWLNPRFHSDRVLQACSTCEHIADLPTGGHGALLSPLPPGLLTGLVGDMLNDPAGFDRRQMAGVDQKITAFFTRHLVR